MYFLGIHFSKAALLRRDKKKFHILQLEEDALDMLKGKKGDIVSGLQAEEILIRSLSLKLKSRREVLAALPFQIENLIPSPSEELIILPTLYHSKTHTDVFLITSLKKTVESHLSRLDFDPDIISCIPRALFRFARHFFPNHPSLFIQHQEDGKNTFIVVKEGRLLASHSAKNDGLERMSAYLHKHYPDIDHLLVTGEEQASFLFSHFIRLEVENPKEAAFAIPIGLALDGAHCDRHSCQFRQNEMLSKKKKAQQKQLITYFSAACIVCISFTLLLGQVHLRKRERALLQALYAPKTTRLKTYVSEMEKSLRTPAKSSIHLPTIPNVSTILSWLSTHPKLTEECSIPHFRYQIIKAPQLGSNVRTYSVKVELELLTQNPRIARSFHEALLRDREMIDHKTEVKWSADHGIYRTTFYLKAKKS